MKTVICPHCGADQKGNDQIYHYLVRNVENYGSTTVDIECNNPKCLKMMKVRGERVVDINFDSVRKSDETDVSFPQAFPSVKGPYVDH